MKSKRYTFLNRQKILTKYKNKSSYQNFLCFLYENNVFSFILFCFLFKVFESGDIEVIANKLYSMQKCLSMLVNVPDYEDKKLQLEGLKNRLEAMASPKLVQAFSSGNLGIICN